ncbi:uncharacterized protein LOC125646408 [Ostrea edulis]|uniref:uncharacterized protein LOC125646408 n=1 Tax=Ostrea edulis TaxID=37623 RepID=UPI002094F79D|nr:uncharacterized protein LOC125646408 [Ostrea edulis]
MVHICEMHINGGWIIYLFVCFHTKFVNALKCFHCNNLDNPACGMYFKPYQFNAQPCNGKSENFKCVLQREPPKGREDWVGIIRSCYKIGSLSMNETNGCHRMRIAGFTTTATLCFCDTDYCNHSSHSWPPYASITTLTSLVLSLVWNT